MIFMVEWSTFKCLVAKIHSKHSHCCKSFVAHPFHFMYTSLLVVIQYNQLIVWASPSSFIHTYLRYKFDVAMEYIQSMLAVRSRA